MPKLPVSPPRALAMAVELMKTAEAVGADDPSGGQRHPYDGEDPVGHGARGRVQVVVDRGEQLRAGGAREGQDDGTDHEGHPRLVGQGHRGPPEESRQSTPPEQPEPLS